MSKNEDPLSIVGKWFKAPEWWGSGDGLIEVISYSRREDELRHYYSCLYYQGKSVTETNYFFPFDEFKQVEM